MNFRINTPDVVQETIDGEVVIVNLKKGDYYSLVNTGADIWTKIEQGFSEKAIIADTISNYEGDVNEITSAVKSLIEQLQTEDIIIPALDQDAPNVTISEHKNQINKPEFVSPKLNKYTDMEELLALDPIHEVDEMGWPNAKIETAI